MCALTIAGTAAIAGCTLGPDYHGAPAVAPNASHASSFNRAPKDVTSTAPAAAEWWKSLNDPELDRLIETGTRQQPRHPCRAGTPAAVTRRAARAKEQ